MNWNKSRAISLAAMALVLFTIGCAQLPPRPELPESLALPVGNDSPLDRAAAPGEAAHPEQSAFRLVIDGTEAFVARMQMARLAGRSLDVQTYIWHADLTGVFLAKQLLDSADRGVKVRLLVDDMDARAKNDGFAALAAHPSIEVRVFNPFLSRRGTWGFVGEGLRDFKRINRRMHNKTWIADNRYAIAGGRNVGDEYFGASDEVNFVDLDFAMMGPVVRDASANFDRFWNSPSAYPMESLDPASVNANALNKLRGTIAKLAREADNSRYAQALRADEATTNLIGGVWPMEWVRNYRFVSDDPRKVMMKRSDPGRAALANFLLPILEASRSDLTIVSPYFVPGDKGTAVLVTAAGKGAGVRVLTNSLAANDVAAVHGGYSRHRRKLLAGGVAIWELKPAGGEAIKSSAFGSSGASLHTKALAVDQQTLFVGSYNLDPRSTWLNCEQGVLVENAVLAAQFRALFDLQSQGTRAWRVTLQDGALRWTDGTLNYTKEPGASFGRKAQAWFARVLQLDPQL